MMTAMIGIIGRKCGMTRVFEADGKAIPVTVVHVPPNRVTQTKTTDTDGYEAIQVTSGSIRSSHVSKPKAGHFAKANVEAGRVVRELKIDKNKYALNTGDTLSVDLFHPGQYVDVTAHSIGKGYQGTIRRHNFRGQRQTHGNSVSHRTPGSIGQNQSPGKVFKGKKMSGHMGNVQRTIQNLQIVRVDQDKNLLLIKGSIPGAPGADVMIKTSVKKPLREEKAE